MQRATDLQKRQYEIDQGIFVEVRNYFFTKIHDLKLFTKSD